MSTSGSCYFFPLWGSLFCAHLSWFCLTSDKSGWVVSTAVFVLVTRFLKQKLNNNFLTSEDSRNQNKIFLVRWLIWNWTNTIVSHTKRKEETKEASHLLQQKASQELNFKEAQKLPRRLLKCQHKAHNLTCFYTIHPNLFNQKRLFSTSFVVWEMQKSRRICFSQPSRTPPQLFALTLLVLGNHTEGKLKNTCAGFLLLSLL